MAVVSEFPRPLRRDRPRESRVSREPVINISNVFKGARSAPGPAGRRPWAAPREDDADLDAAQLTPVTRRAFRGTLRAWAPPAALRPSGPRRRRRASRPAARRTGRAPQRSAPGARAARAGHPPGAPV